jgi:predicted DNA binding protein
MLGVMQVKVSTLVGKENNIPGVKLMELFETVEFLKEFKSSGNPPLYLLKANFKNRKEFDNFTKNETLEIVDYFEVGESHAIFSALMTGPIPQIMSMFENAWPISPTILDSEQLILTIQGSTTGLSNSRKKLIDLLGDSFQISVNNNFQGQWDTAPGLPRRRKEVLETAIEMGYYNSPRRCRQRDIADSIGLKQGTVAEHLQIAETLIINAWFHQARKLGK